MKKRMFLGIGVALIFAGSRGPVVQAQTIYNSIGSTNTAGAGLGLHSKIGSQLDRLYDNNRRIEQMLHQTPSPTSGGSTEPSLGTSEVYIWNSNSSNRVNFSITGDSCSPPLNESLAPYSYKTFTCPSANAFEIMVNTMQGDGSVVTKRYNLRPSARYLLLYDGRISAWDVNEMPHR